MVRYYSRMPGTIRVKLLQGVVVNYESHAAGEVLDVPTLDAHYLVGGGRAEFAAAPVAPPSQAKSEAAPAPVNRMMAEAQPPAEPPAVEAAADSENKSEVAQAPAAPAKKKKGG